MAATALWASGVRGEVAWHPDLNAARTASAVSGKPVLAVFQAAWADESNDVLGSPEVEAVVGACFEPVRLDVDQHADLARNLAVEHVPAARVLDREAAVLAAFDCPSTPSAFVAAAARAAQVAAAATAPPDGAGTTTDQADAFGNRLGTRAHETAAAVSDKVRQLANFADGDSATPAATSRLAGLDAPPAPARPESIVGSRYTAPLPAPTLASTPPTWAAEPAAAAAAFPQPSPVSEPPARAAIDPQQTAATPWLAGAPAAAGPASAPASAPGPAAATAPAPLTAAGPDAATSGSGQPAAKQATGFWATLQKPWSIFSKPGAAASSTAVAASPATAPVEPPAAPPTMPPARPQLPAALAAGKPAPDTLGPMPLGLEGYCPVTVVERGSWVEGRPQWGARHRGRTYLFAGPEQQQAFLADPDRYAPALSGDDPVLAFESGRSEPGRRAYGVSYQSRMYLFSSPESRAAFTADPDRYTARVMIAEGTAPADGIRRF